ncbi:S-layer homology domain-containing protein [Paenibacillus luteus]|uniref:S-layer homology domain-containing protein n=1 Tax=Paenibacillus luteus TaxID=2545753 RepID=UPI00137567E8|nr:S-layer homology domain-containing protein [Paenibacillus luteus]
MTNGARSWVPNMSYFTNVTISGIQEQKPTYPINHIILANKPVVDPSNTGYVSLTFKVYGTDGQLVNGQTEIFAHSADPNIEFYNLDVNDTQNPRNNTVKEGYSWYTVNGLVTFSIKSNLEDILTVPLSIYSGSRLITNDPFKTDHLLATKINVTSQEDASSLDVGTSLTMYAEILPAGALYSNVMWSVEDGTGAATINSNGVLTGTEVGTVTVKATAIDGSAVYGTKLITIKEPDVLVQTISVAAAGEVISVEAGTELQIYAAAAPANATNKAVSWSVLPGTGTASINAASGLLTAGSPGTVTVEAEALDGSGVIGSMTLTITAVPVSSITVTGVSTVEVDKNVTFTTAVAPANATDKAIQWSVENGTGTATINASGVLTGITAGTVSVKAMAVDGSAVYGTKLITITEPVVPVQTISITAEDEVTSVETGTELQIFAAAAPANATNKTVSWSVLPETGTASIDAESGLLTAGSPGTVTVQAKALDGSEVIGSMTLTITAIPVSSITVTGVSTVEVDENVTFTTAVAPANATDPAIQWTVENGTGTATIDVNGVLTGKTAGTITVKATAVDGSAVYGTKVVQVTAKEIIEPTPSPEATPSPTTEATPSPTPETTPTSSPVVTPVTPTVTTPVQTSTPTPIPTPTAKPEVGFNNEIIDVDKLASKLSKQVEEAKANPTNVPFKDTTAHWAQSTVNMFVQLGFVKGYSDGTFHPNASITRGEFAAIIAKVFDLSATANDNKLADVSGHWAESSINALIESGVISGYEDGSFKPNKEISRAEIISIISKIINLADVKDDAASAFNDIDLAWNKDQIQKAASAGIISGQGNGQFSPNKPSSRAEALTIILHTLQMNSDIKTLLDAMSSPVR